MTDYLWDKDGSDPEVEALERALSPLKWKGRLPAAPARRPLRARVAAIAAAAAIAAVAILASPSRPPVGVTCTAGTAMIGSRPLDRAALRVGEWVETADASEARIELPSLGEVRVGADSRVRLVESGKIQRLELSHGTIAAEVTAAPRIFLVDTPAATAVDLGCAYRMGVAEDGRGMIEVTKGLVSLESHGRDATVPAGMRCRMRVGQGPGTPYRDDAPAAFAALERIDFDGDDSGLAALLQSARTEDALSLWHLLFRVPLARRREIFETLSRLSPPPMPVGPEDAERLDLSRLSLWKDDLVIDQAMRHGR